MAFRPKIKLMGEPSAPPGYNYPDTLENFLKPRLDKGKVGVVVSKDSGSSKPPNKRGKHETTQTHHQD